MGVAVEMSGALAKVLPRQCGGNTRGLFYIVKEGREMKNRRLRGKSSGVTNEQSPQDRAFTGDLLDRKSKSPLFPRDGGRDYKFLVHNYILLCQRFLLCSVPEQFFTCVVL